MIPIKYVRGTFPGIDGEHDIAVLEGDTHAGLWVEQARRIDHDTGMLGLIGQHITKDSVVYDLGAYFGDHTAFYASRARMVLAFEAMLDAFNCLTRNMTGRYQNFVLFGSPVGDGAPVVVDMAHGLPHAPLNFGARMLATPNILSGITTSSIRIDDLPEASLYPPNLIKLDIEGWEVSALRGAEQTIISHRPVIVTEVNRNALLTAGTSAEELHAWLAGHGYKMRDLHSNEPWAPEDPRPQFDAIGECAGGDRS